MDLENLFNQFTKDYYKKMSVMARLFCENFSKELVKLAKENDIEALIQILKEHEAIIKEMKKYEKAFDQYLNPVYSYVLNHQNQYDNKSLVEIQNLLTDEDYLPKLRME